MATTKNAMTGINGTVNSFPFTFPYLKTKDLKVELFNQAENKRTELDSTKFDLDTATTVSLLPFTNTDTDSNGELRTLWQDDSSGAPKTGITGNIYRNTSTDQLAATFYPGSAIRSADLNDNYTQNLYATKESSEASTEALDNSRVLVDGVYVAAIDRATNAEYNSVKRADQDPPGGPDAAISIAEDAKTTAIQADSIADEALDNSRTKTDGSEPITAPGTYTSAIYLANQAKNDSETALNNSRDLTASPSSAIDIAQAAAQDASTALSNSQDLTANPSSAIAIAQAAAQDASTALTNSRNTDSPPVSAIDIADDAKLATDRLVATTSDGGSTWTLTGNNTNASTDPKGVGYAVTQAEAAVVTANQAQTAVANSTTYKLTTNKTTFEGNTFDATDAHKAWEIGDSTGITSSYTSFTDNGGSGTAKTVSGVPANFTGDAGLSARFTYDHSNNTFAWSGYWVNDAETRYVVLGAATGSTPQSLSTTAANLPSGTTAQRPGTPVAGQLRFNSTENEFEGYNGSGWGEIGGGLVTIDGGNFTLGTSLVHETESYDGGSFN